MVQVSLFWCTRRARQRTAQDEVPTAVNFTFFLRSSCNIERALARGSRITYSEKKDLLFHTLYCSTSNNVKMYFLSYGSLALLGETHEPERLDRARGHHR